MNEIFIIETISEYYDVPNKIVGFAITEEEAISKVSEKNDLYSKCLSLDKNVSEKISEFKEKHKYDHPFEPQKDYAKWPAGIGEKDITPEMRAERETIREENRLTRERNHARMVITQNAVSKFKEEYFQEIAIDKDVKAFYENEYHSIKNFFYKESPYTYYKLERFK